MYLFVIVVIDIQYAIAVTACHDSVNVATNNACWWGLVNATKYLAGIDHDVKLIPQEMIEPIQKTKVSYLHGNNPRLHTDEVLVALSMLSLNDDNCRKALDCLPQLADCQVHTTVMLSEIDQKIFKKLGIGLTSDPVRKK